MNIFGINFGKPMSAAAVLKPVTAALNRFQEVADNNSAAAAEQTALAVEATLKADAHRKEAQYATALHDKIAQIISV